MAVTSSGVALLFCEGEGGSLDAQVLQTLVPVGVQIVPAGGKRGVIGYRRGYLGSYDDGVPKSLVFCDRDFDVEPPEEASLVKWPGGKKDAFLCHRASIENYLLEPRLLSEYWDGLRGRASPGEAKVREELREAACGIAEYQAVRWALSALKPGARWPEVYTRWTKASGALPDSRERPFEAGLERAKMLIENFRVGNESVTVGNFEGKAKEYRDRLRNPSFWENDDYLTWFHGKDLRAAFQERASIEWSVREALPRIAAAFDPQEFPDLIQLRSRLEELVP